MFERFTDRARRVIVLAQQEAALLGHNYIGTEHILLGLVAEGEGVGAKALESLGIRLEAVRTEVEGIIGKGNDQPAGHIPFTPRSKRVLELSLRESLQLGHNYIGTEHILLGLVAEGEGVGSQVLIRLGVGLPMARQHVIELLRGYGGSPGGVTPPHGPGFQGAMTPGLVIALAKARADVPTDEPIGTHHVLAVFAESEDLAAHRILAAGGFDADALPTTPMTDWDVSDTADEIDEQRIARGTEVDTGDDNLVVRLVDRDLVGRLTESIGRGRISVEQIRRRIARAWIDLDKLGAPARGASEPEDESEADAEPTEPDASDADAEDGTDDEPETGDDAPGPTA